MYKEHIRIFYWLINQFIYLFLDPFIGFPVK